jgi:acetyltransferase-like isoleucine patch superfamily enzyme
MCLVLLVAVALTAKAADVPVFVFTGQSNALGVNTLSELTPAQQTAQPNVLFYGPNETGNAWAPLTPSTNSPNLTDGLGRTGLGSYGPEISTGKTISNALGGALVAEVKYAVGATDLFDQWNPAGSSSACQVNCNLYDKMVARVNQSIVALQTQRGDTGFVAGFFWMQGESDALLGHSGDYAANLMNLIASVRADFRNPDLPFVFGQIIDFGPPDSTTLRAQQQQVANTVANTAFILTDDLGHTDFIHFNGQGIYTMGERFGVGYLSLDSDGDGMPNDVDNCPTIANPDQTDANGDGFGDTCVSPTVNMPPSADFGSNPIIGSGTVINQGVSVGDNAEIGSNVSLDKSVTGGDDLTISDGTKIDRDTKLGDSVSIGANVIIGKSVVIGSAVVIGNNTTIGAGSIVGSNAQIGSKVKVGASVTVAAGAVVPNGASIAANKSFP